MLELISKYKLDEFEDERIKSNHFFAMFCIQHFGGFKSYHILLHFLCAIVQPMVSECSRTVSFHSVLHLSFNSTHHFSESVLSRQNLRICGK